MTRVPVVPRMKRRTIEERAAFIAREHPEAWAGKEPMPVDFMFECELLKRTGVRPIYTDLLQNGIKAHGYTNSQQKLSIINKAVVDDLSERGRRFFRSTVGHELGHCHVHVPLEKWQASLQIVGVGMLRDRAGMETCEDPEWQAWCFCQGLCMPRHLVEKAAEKYGTGEPGIHSMMDMFDMNYSFVTSRLRSLKMIPR